MGCGTGVVSRSIASRLNFGGSVVGSDYSSQLIEAAQRLAEADGVADTVRFEVEDAQATQQPSNRFDAVILHTVVSHLPQPALAVKEAARIATASGTVVVFDGDYASLTIHTGHPDDGTVLQAIRDASSANHHVMRSMPEIMKGHHCRSETSMLLSLLRRANHRSSPALQPPTYPSQQTQGYSTRSWEATGCGRSKRRQPLAPHSHPATTSPTSLTPGSA